WLRRPPPLPRKPLQQAVEPCLRLLDCPVFHVPYQHWSASVETSAAAVPRSHLKHNPTLQRAHAAGGIGKSFWQHHYQVNTKSNYSANPCIAKRCSELSTVIAEKSILLMHRCRSTSIAPFASGRKRNA